MPRKKRLDEHARPTTISLSPAEQLALQVIEGRRRQRLEDRDSPSEIVADALWKLLVDVEGLPREQIEALLPKTEQGKSNLKRFPKKNE